MTIDIVALGTGCELTLTHENVYLDYSTRTETGWSKMLDALAATVS